MPLNHEEDGTVLLRLTRDGTVVFEGEIRPGSEVGIEGMRLEVLWIRKHTDAPKSSVTKGQPGDHFDSD